MQNINVTLGQETRDILHLTIVCQGDSSVQRHPFDEKIQNTKFRILLRARKNDANDFVVDEDRVLNNKVVKNE